LRTGGAEQAPWSTARCSKASTPSSSWGRGVYGNTVTGVFFMVPATSPNLAGALLLAREEMQWWSMARAQGLPYLTAQVPGG